MKELLYQIWLTALPNVASAKIFRIKDYFGDFETAYNASLGEYERALGGRIDHIFANRSLDEANRILEVCEKENIDIITYYDPRYPERLKQIDTAPSLLYVKGRLPEVDEVLTVSIVGARRSTQYGNACATKIAEDLTRVGAIVVSGMARGIDSAAHRGALKGEGSTIAVLGCGVDVCYPPESTELKRLIESHGAVISELPPGSAPLPGNFPARNRIISGISSAVVIVEGKATSGSTITARLALDQGREVFCVPGDISRATSDGPHQLIRAGEGRLVTSAKDIIIDLARDYPEFMVDVMLGEEAQQKIKSMTTEKLPADDKHVLAALQHDFPTHIDDICHKTGIEVAVVNKCLMMLEINGYVVSLPGKQYILKMK